MHVKHVARSRRNLGENLAISNTTRHCPTVLHCTALHCTALHGTVYTILATASVSLTVQARKQLFVEFNSEYACSSGLLVTLWLKTKLLLPLPYTISFPILVHLVSCCLTLIQCWDQTLHNKARVVDNNRW